MALILQFEILISNFPPFEGLLGIFLVPQGQKVMNVFWWRIINNCVNTNLIRIQQESQKPKIIFLPDTWLTCLLGLLVLSLAALQITW